MIDKPIKSNFYYLEDSTTPMGYCNLLAAGHTPFPHYSLFDFGHRFLTSPFLSLTLPILCSYSLPAQNAGILALSKESRKEV